MRQPAPLFGTLVALVVAAHAAFPKQYRLRLTGAATPVSIATFRSPRFATVSAMPAIVLRQGQVASAKPTATMQTMVATGSPAATVTAVPNGGMSATVTPRQAAATPAARTALPLATPTGQYPLPTAQPPISERVPWAAGENTVWTIAGADVSGTAWQLLTRAGHQWIDQSGLQERTYDITSTFFSRLAFDANTFRLRRYDSVQDDPASVLHATLFGSRLDYSSFQTVSRPGCLRVLGVRVPVRTAAYGMMVDLLRTTPLTDGQRGAYTLFDPYGSHVTTRAEFRVLGRAMIMSGLGFGSTVHVRFDEGAEPPLDVWYAAGDSHEVVQWGTPGRFTASLTHYDPGSSVTSLPVRPTPPVLRGLQAACL